MSFERFKIEVLSKLDYAFQPILNTCTGSCMGMEALLRGVREAGYGSIQELFDDAHSRGILYPVEMHLREKAVRKFSGWEHSGQCKLFFNTDNRLLNLSMSHARDTMDILVAHGLHPNDLCIEISERHDMDYYGEAIDSLESYRDNKIKIAIDDFGAGFAGLRMLYHSEPDYIKIDRFFIMDIFKDPRKKLFVSKLINLAHILGIQVIAEGIETREEFYVCREISCDYFQGFLSQRPTTDMAEILPVYPEIAAMAKGDRRKKNSDQDFIRRQMAYIQPVDINTESVDQALMLFKNNESNNFFPVINGGAEPIGILREKDLKKYIYSMYGRQILSNMGVRTIIKNFMVKCATADLATPLEAILELFTMDGQQESEGIIITDNGKYIGFLSTTSLLKLLNEKNVLIALDQNPLTGLPGNSMINDFICRTLDDEKEEYLYSYFDFNYFKAFNDRHGFRNGDRAILLFADILRKNIPKDLNAFIGHIGGDDFFCGLRLSGDMVPKVLDLYKDIQKKFREDVRQFYSDEEKHSGFVLERGRNGRIKKHDLMSVSVASLHLGSRKEGMTPEFLSERIALLKRKAKQAESFSLYEKLPLSSAGALRERSAE